MEKIVDQADCVNDTCDTQFNIMIDLNVPSPAIPSRRDARCMGYHSKFVERTGLCYRYELNLDQVHLGVRTIHTTCNRIHSFYADFSLSPPIQFIMVQQQTLRITIGYIQTMEHICRRNFCQVRN